MGSSPLGRLRRLCLGLPGAEEIETWDTPTFRVRGKIFALVGTRGEAPSVWLKAPPGSQEILLAADPARFFRPPYLGHKGWVGVVLAGTPDWEEVAALVRRSHSLVAPKRLTGSPAPPAPPPRRRARTR